MVIISAVDPPVSTLGQLSDLFNVTNGNRSITPISFQNLFTLDEHHAGETGPYPWAQTGNDTNIPTDKLAGLGADVIDPNTAFTINDTWLPDDIIRSTTTNVITRNAVDDTTTGESLVVAADGVATLTLDHQPDIINDLSDVHATTPTADHILIYREAVTTTGEEAPAGWYGVDGVISTLRDVNLDNTATGEQAIQWDSTNNEWVNVDLPQMASGRIVFDEVNADTYDASEFIPNPALPNASRSIRSTEFVGGLLRFNLATARALELTVPNYPNLAWDVAFGGGSLQATGTTDPLFPDQQLINLFTNSGNITIVPSTAADDPGPWTVSYTDPSLILDTSTNLFGGSTTPIAFRATNSETGDPADDNGMQVTWNNAGLILNDQRFPTNNANINVFLDPYTGFNSTYTLRATGTTLTNTAEWVADRGTDRTEIAGNGTVNGTANAVGNSVDFGGVNAAAIRIASDFVTYHNNEVPTDTILTNFNRPDGIAIGGGYAEPVDRTATSQPQWRYPLFAFSRDDPPPDPAAIDFSVATRIFPVGTNTDPSAAIGAINGQIALTNSGSNVRWLYIGYPSASADAPDYPDSPLQVSVRITIPGSAPTISPVTVAEANHSTAPLDIINTAAGTPTNAGQDYNWFRLRVGTSTTIELLEINP